ncbi:dynein axonemal assembly factor 4 isoform X1 [Nematostella vectensis]|nr:dynein axonemal assembly factor 4 isoform X1 [Nematostella vectensis]
MPLIVKDYEWQQTDVSVRITVPLKGVNPSKADVFSTDEYLKVSYPPYLFEVFLFAPVEDVKGKAAIGNGVVVFSLVKKEAGIWESLQPADAADKEFMQRKREEAIEKAHLRADEEAKKREKGRREQGRYALRQQMKMEEEERQRVADIKEEERRKATEAIENWKETQSYRATITCLDSDDDDDDVDDKDDGDDGKNLFDGNGNDGYNKETKDINTGNSKHIPNGHTQDKNGLKTKPTERKIKDIWSSQQGQGKKNPDKVLPEPRPTGSIQVSFTHQVFKTAARESKAPEEEEWLKKVAQSGHAKQTAKDNPDAVDDQEMNPVWLKEKGMAFYKSGNHVAAINAFTAALLLDGSMPALYSNRAACHLHMKQYKECAQDCTSALELLTPPVPANAVSRCKAYVRRGTAAYHSEEYVEALKDYESALKIDPNNESLRADADRIRAIIQGTGT